MIAKTLKKEWYVLLLLLIPFIASIYFWDQLPDQVPTHFNIHGEADDWGPKWVNAFLLPAIGVFVYLLLIIVPAIDPKTKIKNEQKPVAAIRILTSVFMIFIYVFVMSASLGYEVDISLYIQMGLGALIMLIGNYMNSVKQNYFIGVKTPWTLENEEVWRKTHRFTSKVWTVSGLIMILVPLIIQRGDFEAGMLVGIVAAISIMPVLYSYVIFQKINREGNHV